jgi:hypothetical protein
LSPLRALALALIAIFILPAAAHAQSSTGGAEYPPPAAAPVDITVPGTLAQLLPDGTAAAPADAPLQVQQAVWAGNKLRNKPYKYGGGHAKVKDSGYDCSGTVSFVLIKAGLLESPLDSSSFLRYGAKGPGQWITVYTNPGHAYAVIAGLRLDTSSYAVSTRSSRRAVRSATERGPRWRPTARPSRGFKARHPVGF